MRVTLTTIYAEQLRQGKLLQTLADGAKASAATDADHEARLRAAEKRLTVIGGEYGADSSGNVGGEVGALRSTVSSWSKAMWGLVSGFIITVVGAVVAYGVLAK